MKIINKKKGILFWITGISGSGKTTFGKAIHKDIIKLQVKNWTLKNITNLIFRINNIELIIKKNSNNALYVIFDFLIQQSSKASN